jgi:hypothetical protein
MTVPVAVACRAESATVRLSLMPLVYSFHAPALIQIEFSYFLLPFLSLVSYYFTIRAVLRIRDVFSGYLIPDPTFFRPGSRIRIFSIPDPHKRI